MEKKRRPHYLKQVVDVPVRTKSHRHSGVEEFGDAGDAPADLAVGQRHVDTPHAPFGNQVQFPIGEVNTLGGQQARPGHPEPVVVLDRPPAVVLFAPLALVNTLVAVGVKENVVFFGQPEGLADEVVRAGERGVDAHHR